MRAILTDKVLFRGPLTHVCADFGNDLKRCVVSDPVDFGQVLTGHAVLGAFARRMRARDGAPSAVTAVARKLAIIIYCMLKEGRPYVDRGVEHYDAQYRERQIANLYRRARQLGIDLGRADAA